MDNNTNVVAIIEEEISFIACTLASNAERPLYCIKYSTRSTTIIASSTTRPIAKIMPNKVKIFKAFLNFFSHILRHDIN